MAFMHPAAFAGLLLLAGPLLVHLLLRHRARRVPFPSLRFVRTSRTAAVRVRVPSDLLLLLLRLAIVALAVIALAQPLLLAPARIARWNTRLARAIVLDVSESMKPMASAASDFADGEARSASFAFRIEADHLENGLSRAVAALQTAPPALREIVVISDFQWGALRRAVIGTVPDGTGIRFVQIGSGQSERLVTGPDLLGIGASARRDYTLSQNATGLRARVAQPEAAGLLLLAGPADAGAIRALQRALAAAGTPAPSPAEPLAVVFAGAPAQVVRALDTRWMIETAVRMKADVELADACAASEAVARQSGDAPWHVLRRDRKGQAIVRAAAAGPALLIDVAAPPSAFASAAVVRGALIARQGSTARPEHEVRSMPGADLTALTRSPSPLKTYVPGPGQVADSRWCWALVIVLLAFEVVVRRERNVSRQEGRADAA